jgi:signal transduction histidine kinase
LPTFRLFVAVRVVLLGVAFWWQLIRPGLLPLRPDGLLTPRGASLAGIVIGLMGAVPLLIYLWWEAPRRRLGGAYLPLALGAEVGSILLSSVSSQAIQAATGAAEVPLNWPVMISLALPLILTAWQYGSLGVLIFVVLVAGAELFFAFPLARRGLVRPGAALVVAGVRAILFLLLGYIIARLGNAQRSQRRALARANRRLADYASTMEQLAVSRERNRLARELHDTLAHSLSAVAVQLEAVDALWERDAVAARQRLRAATAATRDGLSEARRAIRALRAEPLEDVGLLHALRAAAGNGAARAGWILQLELPEALERVSPEMEQTIYRVATEALTNVMRHAGARNVSLTLVERGEAVQLRVQDDGRGFDAEAEREGGHFGLRGMEERAAQHGGTVAIQSAPGEGTTLTLTLRKST